MGRIIPFLPLIIPALLLGLVYVATHLPTSRTTAEVAATVGNGRTSSRGVWLGMVAFCVLALLPVGLFFLLGPALDTILHDDRLGLKFFSAYMYALWVLGLVLVGAVLVAIRLLIQSFAAGVPVAQKIGEQMSEAERQELWRHALSAFQQFRRWAAR